MNRVKSRSYPICTGTSKLKNAAPFTNDRTGRVESIWAVYARTQEFSVRKKFLAYPFKRTSRYYYYFLISPPGDGLVVSRISPRERLGRRAVARSTYLADSVRRGKNKIRITRARIYLFFFFSAAAAAVTIL